MFLPELKKIANLPLISFESSEEKFKALVGEIDNPITVKLETNRKFDILNAMEYPQLRFELWVGYKGKRMMQGTVTEEERKFLHIWAKGLKAQEMAIEKQLMSDTWEQFNNVLKSAQ